jgi:hypothetical protein
MSALLSVTTDFTVLKEAAALYHDPVIRRLESLLREVNDTKAELRLDWVGLAPAERISVKIDPYRSSMILENITGWSLKNRTASGLKAHSLRLTPRGGLIAF